MPIHTPVAYNPKTALEDDISFSSQNLVLNGYSPKEPSQEGNILKNGDSLTEVSQKLESRIKDLDKRTEHVNDEIKVDLEKLLIDKYTAKPASQLDNNIVNGDNLKEVLRKLESRVEDLKNSVEFFTENYSTTGKTNTTIDEKIAEATKDMITETQIEYKIDDKITDALNNVNDKISQGIGQAVADIPTIDEININTIDRITEALANVPDENEVGSMIREATSDYLTSNQITDKIDTMTDEKLNSYYDMAQVNEQIRNKINDLIDYAPSTMDTLKEIADSLNNDPDFMGTMLTQLAGKLDIGATAVNSELVNGLTVETAVPAGAVFTDTTYEVFKKSGATAKEGLVPAPPTTAGDVKFLREDCTWQVPFTLVDRSTNGLMSVADKEKLDGIKITSVATGKRYITLADSTDSLEFHTSENFYINCAEKKLYTTNIQNSGSISNSGNFTNSGNITNTGTIQSTGSISSSGDITGNRVFNAIYNDYAELMPRGEDTEPGDIVMLDLKTDNEQYIKAYRKNDEPVRVAGVHSDEFGSLIGGEKPVDDRNLLEYNIDKFIPVALSGRIHVKFIGRSKKGAEVVPSSEPGYGRLYNKDIDDPKMIIGYLVESDDKTDKRKLKIRITK